MVYLLGLIFIFGEMFMYLSYKSIMRYIIPVLVAIVISLLSLKFCPLSYVWASLSWSIVFLLQMKRATRRTTKAFLYNISAIILVFVVFETALSIKGMWRKGSLVRLDRVCETDVDDILGYALQKETTRRARKFYDDNLLYDVVVSVDKNGQRISPPCNEDCTDAILFFGGSFTFGEGVNDNETMPYRVGIESGGKYAIYNFGCHGYGTHQMLSAIEHGLVTSIVQHQVRHVIYLAFYPEHVYRLAGLRWWSKRDPKYLLSNDGQPQYDGHFDDDAYSLSNRIQKQLSKSSLISKFMNKNKLSKADKDLFVAMVSKSRKLLLEQYPALECHMIVWGSRADESLFEKLKREDISIHYIDDILPGLANAQLDYRISRHDIHPNSLSYRLMAQYVVANIIED